MQVVCKSCGCIDSYRTEKKANNLCAFCNDCGAFIKNLPTDVPRMYVGKYKDKPIKDIDDLPYLKWAYDNMSSLGGRQKEAIKDRIYQLEDLLR